MPKDVWKRFENNTLSHSAAHYLMTIRLLLADHGYARVTDVAKHLNITRGSCSISLKPLKRRGLVVEDENKFLLLSPDGERLAEMVERNDQLLEELFRDILGVDQDQAEIDACKIEHLLSIETSMRLAAFLEYIKSERSAVTEFLDDMRGHFSTCTHDTENCPICNNICYLEDE
jgi:Mn-dependent DtxR family transcriptional regulator